MMNIFMFYGIVVGIIISIVINYCYSKFPTCIWLHLQMKCDIVLIMLLNAYKKLTAQLVSLERNYNHIVDVKW